MTHKCKYILMA